MIRIPEIITDREAVQAKIKEATTKLYDISRKSYGPLSGNMILGFGHGAPLFSHDGVTNIKMVRDADPFVDDVIQSVRLSSERNNQKAGDGTTAVVLLAHHLYISARKMEGQGLHARQVLVKLKEAEKLALDYIDSVSKPISEGLLEKVATISANDPALGKMISKVMETVGKDGGVMIESYEGLGVHPEIVEGFYFGKGFRDTALINDIANNQSQHTDVPILISSKRFATEVDIAPIVQKLIDSNFTEVVLIADMGEDAIGVLQKVKSIGKIMIVPVEPPFIAGSQTLFLDDIALLTGARLYTGADFDPSENLGFAKEVLITGSATTVLGGDANTVEVESRIKALREQVKKDDNPQDVQYAKERLARLSGKMAIIKVGGALEFERDELKLRIQDAVCAVQSAMKDGIVPGGGVTLARVAGSEFDDTFKQPFRILMENSGLNPDAYLAHLEGTGAWFGYNLKHITSEPKDALELGVVDPTLVIKEVVRNAISVASALILSDTALAYNSKE